MRPVSLGLSICGSVTATARESFSKRTVTFVDSDDSCSVNFAIESSIIGKKRVRYPVTHHLLDLSFSLDVESVQVLSMLLVRDEPLLSFQLVFDIVIPFAVVDLR